MTLRQYLSAMLAATILAWTAVGLIVTTVDPEDTLPAVFGVFYASVFLAVAGTFSVIGFVLRLALLRKPQLVSRQVAVSFRQAILLATLVVAALALQSRELLTWWNALLVVAALTLLEFFFVSARVRQE
jgi:hypothetical protein